MKKKVILVCLLMLCTTFCFGQKYEWSGWVRMSCFEGIWMRSKKESFNKGLNKWWWHVQFQNRYNQRVAFSWKQYDPADATQERTFSRHTFEVNEIWESTGIGGQETVSVIINDVCFAFKKVNNTWVEECHVDFEYWKKASYAACDNGIPNYRVYSGTKSTNNNGNNINNSSVQQKQIELQKAQQEEQERIRKAQEAKRAQFDGAIQNGDNALNSKKYDNAMSYYSLAKNYAQNSNESTFAQNKYNQAFEAKKTAERQVRVAKQQEKDKKENLEYAGLATSVGGMMALLNDSYSYKWYAMKFQAGLGYENFPIYSNNASQYHVNNSYIESFTLPTFHMGFKSGFFNNKGVSFVLNPLLNAGFSALSAGTSGGYVEYGSTATLYLSHKSRSKFKIFAEGGYLNREGNYSYDADAANGGNSATDDVRKGTFKYDIMKYGGGFMYHLIYDGKETYMRPAVFFEKPSFFTKDDKPVLNFNFQVNISSEIIFDFNYSTDYFIGGDVTYPTTLQPEKMKYFSIKIIKQGKLY